MEYLTTETIVVPVAPGLGLSVEVCLWAARRADDGAWLAVWRLPPELERRAEQIRWTGIPSVVAGVTAIERAPVWLRGLDDDHPVARALDAIAMARAEHALREWLSAASSTEAASHDHERDGRAAE